MIRFKKILENLLPSASVIYRSLRDDRIYKRDIKELNSFVFEGNEYTFAGRSLLGQFISREASGELLATFELLKKSDVFIDVGANQGLFSLLALSIPEVRRIYSFEPSRRNHQVLLANCPKKGEERLIAFHAAVGDSNTAIQLYGGLEGASILAGWGNIQKTYKETVQVIQLDEILPLVQEQERLLVKLDVEGTELNAIKGSASLLERTGETIFVVEISLIENQPGGINKDYMNTFCLFWDKGYDAYTFPNEQKIDSDVVAEWIRSLDFPDSLGEFSYPKRTLNILFRKSSSY